MSFASGLWIIIEWTAEDIEPSLEMLNFYSSINYELRITQENTVVITDNNGEDPRVGTVLYIASDRAIIESRLASLQTTRRSERVTETYNELQRQIKQLTGIDVPVTNDDGPLDLSRFRIPSPETSSEIEVNDLLELLIACHNIPVHNLAQGSNLAHNSNAAHTSNLAQNSNLVQESNLAQERNLVQDSNLAQDSSLAQNSNRVQNSNIVPEIDLTQDSSVAEDSDLAHSSNPAHNRDLAPDMYLAPDRYLAPDTNLAQGSSPELTDYPLSASTPQPSDYYRMARSPELRCTGSQTNPYLQTLPELCQGLLSRLTALKETYQNMLENAGPNQVRLEVDGQPFHRNEHSTIEFTITEATEDEPGNINNLTRTIRRNDEAVPSGLITLNELLPPITSLSEVSIDISDSDECVPFNEVASQNLRLPEAERTIIGIDPLPEQKETDMVPIGDGNARFPRWILNNVDWTSYMTATQRLLRHTFSRRILATHRLAGMEFDNRPTKTFDPKPIDDIIKTVALNCDVPMVLVRNTIIIICAAEAKNFRKECKEQRARMSASNNESSPTSL